MVRLFIKVAGYTTVVTGIAAAGSVIAMAHSGVKFRDAKHDYTAWDSGWATRMETVKDKISKLEGYSEKEKRKFLNSWFSVAGKEGRQKKAAMAEAKGPFMTRGYVAGAFLTTFLGFAALAYGTQPDEVELTEDERAQLVMGISVMELEIAELKGGLN